MNADDAGVLLDASALIAFVGKEPGGAEVRGLLADGSAAITTLNLAEAIDRLTRRFLLSPERTRPVIDGLLDTTLALVPLGSAEAWRTAEIRSRHYHRTSCPLSLADCVLLASAAIIQRRLASSDRYVLAVARREGIAMIGLLDSQGRRAMPFEPPLEPQEGALLPSQVLEQQRTDER